MTHLSIPNTAALAIITLVTWSCAQPTTGRLAMPDSTRTDNKRKSTSCSTPASTIMTSPYSTSWSLPTTWARRATRGRRLSCGRGRLHTAFPDIHYTIDEVVGEEDRVAIRWHWAGTHRGTFRGIPASGKAVSTTGAAIFRLSEGKIVSAALETDRLGFLQQIGAIPEDAVPPSSPPSPRGGTRSPSSSPGGAAP